MVKYPCSNPSIAISASSVVAPSPDPLTLNLAVSHHALASSAVAPPDPLTSAVSPHPLVSPYQDYHCKIDLVNM